MAFVVYRAAGNSRQSKRVVAKSRTDAVRMQERAGLKGRIADAVARDPDEFARIAKLPRFVARLERRGVLNADVIRSAGERRYLITLAVREMIAGSEIVLGAAGGFWIADALVTDTGLVA